MDSDTFCHSDGEVIEGNINTPKRDKDDELTSLAWLQNSNLLSGTVLLPIKLQLTTVNPHNDSLENNCSNTNENSTSFVNDLNNSWKNNEKSKTAKSSMRHNDKISSNLDDLKVANCNLDQANNVANEISIKTSTKFDFELKEEELQIAEEVKKSQSLVSNQNRKLPISVKPPLSFSCLIFMAIENSTTKALPVKDIYSWIINQYPYYRSAPSGWKNSVRHNLSLNKCFSKVEKSNLGKGSSWMVDPNYRPNLLQAMSKAPIRALGLTDYVDNNLDELSIMKNINGFPNDGKSKSSSIAHLVTSNKIHSSSSSKQIKSSGSPLPDHQPMPFNGHCTKNSLSIIDTSIRASSNSSGVCNTTSVNAADRLRSTSEYKERNSSRLVGCSTHSFNNVKSNDVVNGFDAFSMGLVPSEDVDAAAAMLTLKHGPHAFRYSSNHDNLNGLSLIVPSNTVSNHDHLKRLEGVDKMVNDDSKTMDFSVSEPEIADKGNRVPTSISHFSNSFDSHHMEFNHFGETDALLNLAAVATSLASNEISYQDFNDNKSQELETANLFSEKGCLNGKPEVSIQPIQNGQNFSNPIETPNRLTNGKFLENGIGAFSSRRSQLESKEEMFSKKKRDLTDGRLTPKHVKNSKQSLLTKKSSTNHSKISSQKFIRLKDGHTRKTLIRCKKVLKENNNNKLSFSSKSKKVIKKSKNLFYKSLNKFVKRN